MNERTRDELIELADWFGNEALKRDDPDSDIRRTMAEVYRVAQRKVLELIKKASYLPEEEVAGEVEDAEKTRAD